MDRFDPRWVWYVFSIICAISIAGFYGLHLRTKEWLIEKQVPDTSDPEERS